MFDTADVRRVLSGHDIVINLATHVPPNSRAFLPGAWKEMDRIRREGSRVLATAAASLGIQRFIQESFAPIYPDNGDRWTTEAVAPTAAAYNRSVLDAEASAMRFGEAGRTGIALRFAFLYGPNDPFTNQLFEMTKRGWLPLLGARDAYFPMVTHEDAAGAVVAAITAPGGVYNVVDDRPITHEAIGDVLANILGVRPPKFLPTWVAKLAGSLGETLARSLRISNAKLRGIGWKAAVPNVDDGLRRAFAARRS
jgi:nucleoside-diphosphate-sugar epimerase